MATPNWLDKAAMGINWGFDHDRVNENKLIRLAFHDCIPYEDGTGGKRCQNRVPLRTGKIFLKKKYCALVLAHLSSLVLSRFLNPSF